jgi:hypothetical protein
MMRGLVVALMILAGSATSHAASFRLEGTTIHMSGRIVAADPLRLSQLIGEGARAIVLESPGGLVAAGSWMADMIRDAGLKTIVRGDCASACTMMFYAGVERKLTGRLGIHRATDEIGTAKYAAQLKRYGAPAESVRAARDTPPSRITLIR